MKKTNKKSLVEGHVVARNKNVYRYGLFKKYIAGISLKGTEVKSLISNGADLQSSFVVPKKGSMFLINANISKWENAALQNHDPKRSRRLLLNRSEIRKIQVAINEKGMTAIPIKIIRLRGKFKVEIATAKRLKLHDKRERLKEKEIARDKARSKK